MLNIPISKVHRDFLQLLGGLIAGSAVHMLLGASGCISFSLRFIGPLTIAPMMMMVTIVLSQPMQNLAQGHWGMALL